MAITFSMTGLGTHGVHPVEPIMEVRVVLDLTAIWSAEALRRQRRLEVLAFVWTKAVQPAVLHLLNLIGGTFKGVLQNPTTLTKA